MIPSKGAGSSIFTIWSERKWCEISHPTLFLLKVVRNMTPPTGGGANRGDEGGEIELLLPVIFVVCGGQFG